MRAKLDGILRWTCGDCLKPNATSVFHMEDSDNEESDNVECAHCHTLHVVVSAVSSRFQKIYSIPKRKP